METKVCKVCGRELGIDEFAKNVYGVTNVCRECAGKKKRESWAARKKAIDLEKEVENAKSMRLSDFTPRELITELARRGYEGKITYTKIETIDLSNF